MDESFRKNAPPSDHSIVSATLSLPKWSAGHIVPDPPPAPSPGPHPPAPSPPGPKSNCAQLKCGGHDDSCWCTDSCKSHGDCCPDYDDVCGKPAISTNITAIV